MQNYNNLCMDYFHDIFMVLLCLFRNWKSTIPIHCNCMEERGTASELLVLCSTKESKLEQRVGE